MMVNRKNKKVLLSWDMQYKTAKKYYEEKGHLMVKDKEWYDDIFLGSCIHRWRTAFKQGIMPQNQIDQLNAIGMVWDVKQSRFDHMYSILVKYKKEYGKLSVPYHFEYEGERLGIWVMTLKNAGAKLPQNQIDALNSIGFRWKNGVDIRESLNLPRHKEDAQWNQTFDECCLFFEQTHILPTECKKSELDCNGKRLKKWLESQKKRAETGYLIDWKKDRLETLSPSSVKQSGNTNNIMLFSWQDAMDMLSSYANQHENLDVRQKDGDIYELCTLIREKRKLGKLSADRIAALNAIGFIWDTRTFRWLNNFNRMKTCIEESSNMADAYAMADSSLKNWFKYQRKLAQADNLEEDRRLLFLGLEVNLYKDIKGSF